MDLLFGFIFIDVVLWSLSHTRLEIINSIVRIISILWNFAAVFAFCDFGKGLDVSSILIIIIAFGVFCFNCWEQIKVRRKKFEIQGVSKNYNERNSITTIPIQIGEEILYYTIDDSLNEIDVEVAGEPYSFKIEQREIDSFRIKSKMLDFKKY